MIGMNFFILLIIIALLYSFFPFSSMFKKRFIDKKLEKSDLDEVLNEERRKLGIDKEIDIEIKIGKGAMGFFSNVEKLNDKKYKIEILDKPLYKNRGTVAHELYHIYRGDFEGLDENSIFDIIKLKLLNFTLYDIRAWIYDTFGKKL